MADSQKYSRTEQLLDKDNIVDGGPFYPSLPSSGPQMVSSTNTAILLIPCKPSTTYTVSRSTWITHRFAMCFVTSANIYEGMPITGYQGTNSDTGTLTLTSTSDVDSAYLCLYYAKTGGSGSSTSAEIQAQLAEVMINEGNTALPYQPYLDWHHSLRKLGTATEAVENPLYSDGTAITSYTIKGNTVQNGTPTPSNPVDVIGVGERTENLFDSSFTVGYYLNATTGLPQTTDDPRMATLTPIDVTDYNSVTFNFTRETSYLPLVMYSILDGNTLVSRVAGQSVPLTIDTSNATKLYLCVYPPDLSKRVSPDSISSVMLNTGSTAKPFEPYGYKIPILSNQQTTNIYLGSTQTTRQIKKLVLTGEENWRRFSTTDDYYFYPSNLMLPKSQLIATHYTYATSRSAAINNSVFTNTGGGENIWIRADVFEGDVAALKTYLQQQYAAGTPVTIYYVLATAETGQVNEPLMKIGDYADTLSNATAIPTTEGANSITVDTTVQPSEFTATWTGWHNASVKEYDGTDWQ